MCSCAGPAPRSCALARSAPDFVDEAEGYFDQVVREARERGAAVLAGDKIFKLYDTFGFPLDLSQDLAREKALSVDEAGFAKELEGQKQRARLSWKGETKRKEKQVYEAFKDVRIRACVHEKAEMSDVRIVGLLKEGRRAEVLAGGEKGEVILEATPFYAEAGGQVGDIGTIKGPKGSALVGNVFYATPEVISHAVGILTGEFHVGDLVDAVPDLARRQAVSANHTATHRAASGASTTRASSTCASSGRTKSAAPTAGSVCSWTSSTSSTRRGRPWSTT